MCVLILHEYSGEFAHNLPQTYADVCCRMLTYASAFMLTREFSGEFAHNLPHGKGVMLWPNASRYEGEWKRGKPHGMGSWRHADTGDEYQGICV